MAIEAAENISEMADELSKMISQFKIGEARLNIKDIKGFYLDWSHKLECALCGMDNINLDDINDAHQCDFSKWYDKEGSDINDLPIFKEIGDIHIEVHELGKKIVELTAQGKMEEARGLMSELVSVRKRFFEGLDELYIL